MRKLIYAINMTLDGCFDHPPEVPMTKYSNIPQASCEMLTCSSMGVKPMN
jgi:hypothetical protein